MTAKVSEVVRRVRRVVKTKPAQPPSPPKMYLVAIGFASNNGIGPKVGDSFPEDSPFFQEFGIKVGKKLAKDFGPEFSTGFFTPAELGTAYMRTYRERYNAKEVGRAAERGEQREAQLKAAEDKFKPKEPEPTPLSRQRLCIRHAGAFGASQQIARKQFKRLAILPGEIVDEREDLVKEFPDRFVRVLPEGLRVEDALVCVATEPIKRFSASGLEIERILYPSQLIHKDDEFVLVNPTMFGPVGTPVSFGREATIVARPEQVTSDSGRFVRSPAD